jgi:hypothetical protein
MEEGHPSYRRYALRTGLAVALLAACLRVSQNEEEKAADAKENALAVEAGATRATQPAPARMVVMVAIDGVRHQEIFGGVDARLADEAGLAPEERLDAARLTPNLHWLLATRGAAIGAPGYGEITASGKHFISLPGYLEMLSGVQAHTCESNECDPPAGFSTLADAFATRARGPADVAVFASWPSIRKVACADCGRVFVSAGRGGTNHTEVIGADAELARIHAAGEEASAEPGYDGYRRDAFTAPLALRFLRVHEPRFLFVSLGDTDEHAHKNDYRAYLRALREADAFLGEVAVALADRSASGTPTLLLVTADHGRASADFTSHGEAYTDSGRVWLVAAGDPIAARGYAQSPAPRFLADLAPTIAHAAGLGTATMTGQVLGELFDPPPIALGYQR